MDREEDWLRKYQALAKKVLAKNGFKGKAWWKFTIDELKPLECFWAYELLFDARSVEACIEENDARGAAYHARRVAEFGLRILTDAFSKPVTRGAKVLKKAKEGHELVYGTPEEKETVSKSMQTALDEAYKQNPERNITSLRLMVAKQFGVTPITIKRRTRSPIKKKSDQSRH